MSGTGKSVMAAAFARSRSTRLAFGSGVVWVSASRLGSDHAEAEAELRDSLERELKHLPARLTVADLADPAVRLLVIVDDARAAGPLYFLWNRLGVECRVIVTTQHADLEVAFGADGQAVTPLHIDDALMFVARFSRTTPEALGADARDVVARLGGVAFALSVAGALVAAGDSWADLREKLEHRDLSALAHDFPNYPHPSVFAMLEVAVSRITPDDQILFRSLHVFSATQPVPESVVVAFWRRMGGGRPDQLRSLMSRLTQRSLLSAEGESPQRLLRIHDLLAAYCRKTGTDGRSAAALLLETYQADGEMHLPGTPEQRYGCALWSLTWIRLTRLKLPSTVRTIRRGRERLVHGRGRRRRFRRVSRRCSRCMDDAGAARCRRCRRRAPNVVHAAGNEHPCRRRQSA